MKPEEIKTVKCYQKGRNWVHIANDTVIRTATRPYGVVAIHNRVVNRTPPDGDVRRYLTFHGRPDLARASSIIKIVPVEVVHLGQDGNPILVGA